MMKKLILGACLACGLVQVECWGMDKFKGEDHLICKKLVVYNGVVKEPQRKLSEPVTQREKSEALHRVSVDEFLKMNESETQQYEDIEFHHVKIDREFADKFWEAFINGVNNLLFDSCTLLDNCKFTDILDGDYQVTYLSVVNCNIKLDDVDDILCLLYPYSIKKLNFKNNGLSVGAVRALVTKRLKSFAKSIDCSV